MIAAYELFALNLLALVIVAVPLIVIIWLIVAFRRLLIEIRDACKSTTMEVQGVKTAIERLGQPK